MRWLLAVCLPACSEYKLSDKLEDDPAAPDVPAETTPVVTTPPVVETTPSTTPPTTTTTTTTEVLPEEPQTIAIVLSEFFTQTVSQCEGVAVADRELDEMVGLLAEMGRVADVFEDSTQNPVTADQLDDYDLVVLHNGGWGNRGSVGLYDAMLAVADAGHSVMFLGDDAWYMAWDYSQSAGSDWYGLMGMGSWVDNGSYPADLVVTTDHPVVSGPWGTFTDFQYTKDPDRLVLSAGTALVSYDDGTGTWPVVTAIDGSSRAVVADVSIYTSDVCPLGDAAGVDSLRVMFQNAVEWLLEP